MVSMSFDFSEIRTLSAQMFIVGSVSASFLGYLGGHCIKVFDASVVPAAHGFVFGAFPLMTLGVYMLADKINKGAMVSNALLAVAGGYVASYAASNVVGLSISLAGPIASASALAIAATVVGAVAGPCIICWAVTCLSLPVLGNIGRKANLNVDLFS